MAQSDLESCAYILKHTGHAPTTLTQIHQAPMKRYETKLKKTTKMALFL